MMITLPMHLIVKCMDIHQFLIETHEQMTIGELKEKISKIILVDKSRQYLIIKGVILENEITIGELGLHDMDRIYLSAKDLRERLKKYSEKKSGFAALNALLQNSVATGIGKLMDNLKEKNPMWSHVLNDEDTVFENLNALKSPHTRREFMKMNDRTLNMAESKPGGMRDMIRHHHTITKVSEEMMDTYRPRIPVQKTLIPEKPAAPCTEPLPVPYEYVDGINLLLKLLMSAPPSCEPDESVPARDDTPFPEFTQIFFDNKPGNELKPVQKTGVQLKLGKKTIDREPSFWDSSSDDDMVANLSWDINNQEPDDNSSENSDIECDCDID